MSWSSEFGEREENVQSTMYRKKLFGFTIILLQKEIFYLDCFPVY